MAYGMYISAEGVQALNQRMEVVANNLANVNTPGFKRDLALFQARYAEAIEQGLATAGEGAIDDIGGGVMMADVMTDFSPGTLRSTGRPTDMAIEGEGFFEVEHDGKSYLTRAGDFQLDATGRLITADGKQVLDDSGGAITIRPDLGPWRLSPDGAIQQAGTNTRLSLVRPASLNDLVKVGENLFSSLGVTERVPPTERRVREGFIEMSSVNSTTAMMELIETSRSIEANVKLIQSQDSMLGSLIDRLLKA